MQILLVMTILHINGNIEVIPNLDLIELKEAGKHSMKYHILYYFPYDQYSSRCIEFVDFCSDAVLYGFNETRNFLHSFGVQRSSIICNKYELI
jgi:hypothetical protein